MEDVDPAGVSVAGTCSCGKAESPTETLGTDHVDGEEPSVKLNDNPLVVTAESGTPGVAGTFPVRIVLTLGGRGGRGGRSFGKGGISRTSSTPFAPADVQLEDPENESEPSTPVASVVLDLRAGCCADGNKDSPLGNLLGGSGAEASVEIGKAGAGKGGMCSIKLVEAVDGRMTLDVRGLGGAVVADIVLGDDGAVEDVGCGRTWDTDSRRFSLDRRPRHPPGDLSSFSPSRSPS